MGNPLVDFPVDAVGDENILILAKKFFEQQVDR